MLKVEVKKGNIEAALKKLKSKFIKTKVAKECRERSEFTKPSVIRRAEKIKAKYVVANVISKLSSTTKGPHFCFCRPNPFNNTTKAIP